MVGSSNLSGRKTYENRKSGAPTAVYSYEDMCGDTFQVAKRLGLKCAYELPIAYWQTSRRLLEEEGLRLPLWEPTLGGTKDSDRKLENKPENWSWQIW